MYKLFKNKTYQIKEMSNVSFGGFLNCLTDYFRLLFKTTIMIDLDCKEELVFNGERERKEIK